MHAPGRPVPSYSALKALRQLAYVASGTACGAAAIVYEERRRQIHFLKQVAENGKILSNVARRRRRRHEEAGGNVKKQTSSVGAADIPTAAVAHSADLSVAREDTGLSDSEAFNADNDVQLKSLSFRDEALPSQVDRSYSRWIRRQHRLGLEQESDTSRHGSPRQKMKGSTGRSQYFLLRRTDGRPQVPLLVNKCISARAFHSGRRLLDDQRNASTNSQMDDINTAIAYWRSVLPDHDRNLENSFQTLMEATTRQESAFIDVFSEEPFSLETLLEAAMHLRLPDLLLELCRYAIRSNQMAALLPRITRSMMQQSDTEVFSDATAELLKWTVTAKASSEDRTLSLSKLRWCQISLLAISESREQTDALHGMLKRSLEVDSRNGQRLSKALLQDVFALEPIISSVQDELTEVVEILVETGRLNAATQLLQECIEVKGVVIIKPILQRVASDLDVQQLRQFASILRSRGMDCGPVIEKLWRNATSDMDLLDLYEDFGLEPLPGRIALTRLFHAKMKHCSAHTIASDLTGSSARLWTGALARDWEKCEDPKKVFRQFWEVQNSLGTRQLHPELYQVVIRKFRHYKMDIEADKITQFREHLFRSSKLAMITADLLRLSRASKWEAVSQQLRILRPRDFGTMQTQQRAQIFDPVIRLYATENRTASELFNMGLSIFNRVYDYTSPSQALRLLAMSLTRNGQISTLIKVHREAEKLLGQPFQITPVDATDLLRSFYYSYRPSHIGLATVMSKTFQDAWQSVSRLCLPLLLVSASYEGQRTQQKRSASEAAELVRSALLNIDEPEVRNALMLESRLAGSVNGSRSLRFPQDSMTAESKVPRFLHKPVAQEQMATERRVAPTQATTPVTDSMPYKMIDSSLLPAFFQLSLRGTEVRQSAALVTSDVEELELLRSALPTIQPSDVTGVPPSAWKPTDEQKSVDRDSRTPVEEPTRHSLGSTDGHFAHNLTKALLHGSDGRDGEADAATLVQRLEERNALAPSASIASLAARSTEEGLSSLRQIFELAGTDATLSDSRGAISRIAEASLDAKQLEAPETMDRLKEMITAEYGKLERGGHTLSHALATAMAQLMLRHDRPACAIELIRHALKLPWGSIIQPGIATMLMLLKAYIALGRTDGIRWVVGHVMARGERMEKSFLNAFKMGRRLWECAGYGRLDAQARAALVVELGQLQRICIEYQGRQIAASWKVGNELAAYIGEHSAPAKKVEWSAEDEFATRSKRRKDDGDTERFKDAVYVQSICADVLTLARKSRGTVGKSAKAEGMDLRYVRAMKRVEGSRRRRSRAQA